MFSIIIIVFVLAVPRRVVVVAICSNLHSPIDLSYPLDEFTVNWDRNFTFRLVDRERYRLQDGTYYAKNNFVGAEHGGTHLDAPFHFNENGWKVGDIPLSNLICRGIVVDLREKVNDNADSELLAEDFEEWEKIHGPVPNHTVVLVNFGWSSKYSDRVRYFGNDRPPYRFPGISESAARWIVNSNKIRGVGVDTPSLDRGSSATFDAHKIIARSNLFGLENVAFPDSGLPAKNFDLIVLPLKIREGSGAPCRVVAI